MPTLTGEVKRVTYENEATSFRVIKLLTGDGSPGSSRVVTVVGTFQAVGPGTRIRATGEFTHDPRHGDQFRAETLLLIEPDTLEGLEKYLGSGLVPGVGPGFARRIVRTFGLRTLEVLDQEPQRLRQVPGLGQQRLESIKKAWTAKRAVSSIMVLLRSQGASPAMALRIYDYYGDRAAVVVQRWPYRLALDVRGIGFATADRLARSLGISGDHPERAQAGVWHELGEWADAGNTVIERRALVDRTAARLEISHAHADAAVDALWASERIVVDELGVSISRLCEAERATARGIARLLSSPATELGRTELSLRRFEQRAGVQLASAQVEAVRAVAEGKVVVITGGPGVGKTTILRTILEVMTEARLAVRLAAPTGRAAKRLADATRHEATTLHRLLEFEPRTGRFLRDGARPVDADVVIVDEASMVDIGLGAALLTALKTTTRLVIVGDADQLPSVGPGAFLRDIIDSNMVPCVRLQQIFRQGEQSRIVRNAHRILHGEMPESATADDSSGDFFVISRTDPEQAAQLVEQLVVRRIPQRFNLDPTGDIQVLTPMHRGPAGTLALNEALQSALNPGEGSLTFRGQQFGVGDKVMQTRNDYEREVYNGDIGRIVALDAAERVVKVRLDDRDIDYRDDDLENLTLAYATSIHKSQGSEYAAVVVPILTSHYVMLSRNLIYTAVTRARKLCVLVAHTKALRIALGETRRELRQTRLRLLLQGTGSP